MPSGGLWDLFFAAFKKETTPLVPVSVPSSMRIKMDTLDRPVVSINGAPYVPFILGGGVGPSVLKYTLQTTRLPRQVVLETTRRPRMIRLETTRQPRMIRLETTVLPRMVTLETTRKPKAVVLTSTRLPRPVSREVQVIGDIGEDPTPGTPTHIKLDRITLNSATTLTAASPNVIRCDASGGAFTVTLPAVATADECVFWVKRMNGGGNAVTIDANGAELIDGNLALVINRKYQSYMLHCNGTDWGVH